LLKRGPEVADTGGVRWLHRRGLWGAAAVVVIAVVMIPAFFGRTGSGLPAGESHCSTVQRCVGDAETRAPIGHVLFPRLPDDSFQGGYYSSPGSIDPDGAVQLDYVDPTSGLPFYWKIHPDSLRVPSVCSSDGSNMSNMVTASGLTMCFMTHSGGQFFYSVGKTLYVLQAPSSPWPAISGFGSPKWALAVLASLGSDQQVS
jgi:hypothetical protein